MFKTYHIRGGDDTESSINKLFEYIRGHDWENFTKILESDDTIDVNVRDIHSNHLLTYAVRFNRLDIVTMLLDRGARYDIVDRMERSILYDAIELSFNSIVVKLLETSEQNIGIMITDIRDLTGNIPLHYAIKFKRPELVELMIKFKSNPHTIDTDGYNALHLAVRSGIIDIVQSVVHVMSNLDTKTSNGETGLHIAINYQYNVIADFLLSEGASPNIVDNDNEFSPLHYAVGWNNIYVVKILLKTNADPNIQDIYGNTPLMYCIKEDYAECFDLIVSYYTTDKSDISGKIGKTGKSGKSSKSGTSDTSRSSHYKLNYNLWNIEGKILLHEVLASFETTSHLNPDSNQNKIHYIDQLISESSLTIQDSQGNTCMHYLVALNLWEKYTDILKTKRINIFAKNSSGVAVVDMLYTNNTKDKIKLQQYNKLLDVVVEGYIHTLRKEKKSWAQELDKICSRHFSELTDKEKKYIMKLDTDIKDLNDDTVRNECFMLIRNKLKGDIKRYLAGQLEYCQRSYPTNITECVDIKEGLMLDVCTFTGSELDVLIGLMFLLKNIRMLVRLLVKIIHLMMICAISTDRWVSL